MHHLIINPASKSGKGVHIFERLEPYLIKQKADYQTYFTTGNGDATIFIREIIDTSVVIPVKVIVLGGDGTINEVLQGIDDFSKVILGYIPTGSSNDLARDLQLSKDPIVNLNSILDGKKTVTMDIGQITYEDGSSRKFAVSGGIGFDAAVCEEAMYSAIKDFLNHIGLGKLTYLGIALRQLFTAKKASCDLYIDDNDPIHINRLLFIASMVHKYEGGGFLFCPEASYKDGLLDICAVGNISIVSNKKTTIF